MKNFSGIGIIKVKLGGIQKSNPPEKEDFMKKLLVALSAIFLILALVGTGFLSFRDLRDGSDLAKLEKTYAQSGVDQEVYNNALKAISKEKT